MERRESKSFPYRLKQGLVHVYTGDGKGKTTAAVGLAVRAAGAGLKVGFFQFFKKPFSGELAVMNRTRNIHTYNLAPMHPRFQYFSREDLKKYREQFERTWKTGVVSRIRQNHYDVIILDEILIGIRDKFIGEEKVLELIGERPVHSEIILTGRYATDRIIDIADIITDMKEVKHPFPAVKARRGIEY